MAISDIEILEGQFPLTELPTGDILRILIDDLMFKKSIASLTHVYLNNQGSQLISLKFHTYIQELKIGNKSVLPDLNSYYLNYFKTKNYLARKKKNKRLSGVV